MTQTILQCLVYLIILVALGIALGAYMGRVMNGENHIHEEEEMNWKKYALSAVLFHAVGFTVLFLILTLHLREILN